LLDSLAPGLDGDEALVVRRGRNVRSSRQGKAPGASYTASTAFEALLGYLLVSGQHERLYEVLDTEWGKQGGS
jgi:ribonuclease-3 family protein